MREMTKRGMLSGYGFSGTAYSGMVKLSAEFIGGDMMAQLTSFQEAFKQAGITPSNDDLAEVWRAVEDRYENGLRSGERYLQGYLAQYGDMRVNAKDTLAAAAGHDHDKVLHEWNVWRTRAQLSKPKEPQTHAGTQSYPTQKYFPAGADHDAFVEIRRILSRATKQITIVDSHVDETLWTLLTNVPSSVRIHVLTNELKGDFILEARKFQKQHGHLIEVRKTGAIHDRLIIADQECWHLGASIKDAGSKAFMLSEVRAAGAARDVFADAAEKWNEATPLDLIPRRPRSSSE